jgi:hypothetical protein
MVSISEVLTSLDNFRNGSSVVPLESALMAAEGVRLTLRKRMARHTVVWNRDRHDGACRQPRSENTSLAAAMPFNAAGKPAYTAIC